MAQFTEHFALIRQIATEANHFPPHVRQAWQDAGPRAARAELARHLDLLIRQGLLEADNPGRAAAHFHLLAFAEIIERSEQGTIVLDDPETDEIITAGVRTFLYGHLPH